MTDLLPKLLEHFLISLSLGTALFSWIAKPELTGAGFIRLIVGHGFIFLTLTLIMIFIFKQNFDSEKMGILFGLLAVLGIQWKFHQDNKTKWMWFLYIIQVVLTSLLIPRMAQTFVLSSILLLGITHYAMLLGHYYLVVPKLTEKPLLLSLKIFWIFITLKMISSAHETYLALPYLEEGTTLGDGFVFNWLLVSMRWLWGYLALIILSWFAWKLCRMRSIQSATGVLYIMVFFVFIGEIISTYLYLRHGLAI